MKDEMKSRLARVVLERVLSQGHLQGWLDTLGELGKPPAKGTKSAVPAQTRVTAAKAGVDFVTKFLGDAGATQAGQDLLAELGRMEKMGEGAPDEESTDVE